MAFRDVIINAYSCPPSGTGGAYPPDICGGTTGWLFEQIWAPLQVKPVSISLVGKGKMANDFSDDLQSIRSMGGLRGFIKNRVSKLGDKWGSPSPDVGRVALVGFSAGCGAVNSLLSSSDNVDIVDTVILLDGMHGRYKQADFNKKEPNGTTAEDIMPASYAAYLNFALKAAAGDKMMVVTHSKEIVNSQDRTVASTAKTAAALVEATLAQIGEKPQPQIVPEALLGMNGKSPRPPTREDGSPIWPENPGCWPNKWNSQPIREPVCSWPLGTNNVVGNLITLGTSMSGTNNEASHMFHSYWMYKAVLEEVLAPRWTFECEKGAFSSKASASNPGFVRPSSVSSTQIKRNPKLVRRFGSPSLSGIGDAFCDIFSCEGVFTGITGSEIDRARLIWQASWLAASALAAGGLYYWLKNR